ncbi:S41 family peptidase [Spirosoma flavus]
MRSLYLTVFYVVIRCSLVHSQSPKSGVKYSVAQLKQDIRLLKKALEEAHPSLYWYTSKKEIDDAFAKATYQIRKPLTKREFYQVLAPVVTLIRCGHTYLLMAPGEDPPVSYLPFDSWLDQNRLFIINNKSSDSTILAGDEITHINGYPISAICQKGKSIQSADGYNQSLKQYYLNWHVLEDVAWEYYGNKEPFQLTIVSADGRSAHYSVYKKTKKSASADSTFSAPKVLTEAENQANLDRQRAEELDRMRNLKVLSDVPATALLTINGFGYDDAEAFHKEVFKQLNEQNIQHLIIDLRQNPGGNVESAANLMGYMMHTRFQIIGDTWATLRNPNTPSFSQYFDAKTKQLFADNTTYLRQEGNRFYFKTGGSGWLQPQSEPVFKGKVYLLTSGFTFSAGALLAVALKSQRQAVVIGQETGGGKAGCSGGINQTLTLPNTQLWLKFPLFRVPSASPKSNRGRGLMPDYAIHYRWQDKKEGRDLELEKAQELIKKQSK